jgi:hypothetical protein
MATPTPADVKNLPLTADLLAAFAAVAHARVQQLIDAAVAAYGGIKGHTQRDDAMGLHAPHHLFLALRDEGVIKSHLPAGGSPWLTPLKAIEATFPPGIRRL